jgi:predicted Zn-dependent protease
MDSQDLKRSLASIISDSKYSQFTKVMADYGMSQVAKNGNDFNRSLDLLDKVISFFPDKNILKVDKGNVQLAAGQFAEAESTLRKALEVDGSDMYAMYSLAKLLYRTGQTSDAEKYYLMVSYELPEYSKVYFELGQIASDQKLSGNSSFYLGKYYLYEGRIKEAEQNIKNALRADTLPEKMKEEGNRLLEKIKMLKK